MATKQPSINVTFDLAEAALLDKLSKKRKLSLSRTVHDLTLEALELQEDIYFSKLANEIDNEKAVWVSHKDAWK